MVRVDAQGKQQRVLRNLHDPSGGESLACLPVGHTSLGLGRAWSRRHGKDGDRSEGQAIEFELASNRGKTSAENLKVRR